MSKVINVRIPNRVKTYEQFIEGYKEWKREKENNSDNADKKEKENPATV